MIGAKSKEIWHVWPGAAIRLAASLSAGGNALGASFAKLRTVVVALDVTGPKRTFVSPRMLRCGFPRRGCQGLPFAVGV